MASYKDTFEAWVYRAWTFASGAWRGRGAFGGGGGLPVVTPAKTFTVIEGASLEYLEVEAASQEYLVLESAVSVELADWAAWENSGGQTWEDALIRYWEDGTEKYWEDSLTVSNIDWEDGTARVWEDYVGSTTSGGYFIPIEGPPQ